MASTRDNAVVLRCWDFSETSQTVALLCRDGGMLRGLAKGSRRVASRFGGGFEPLTRGEVSYISKPSSELATLTEWDLAQVYWGPRRDLRAHHAGMFMADATFHAVLDHDPHPGLFDALSSGLAELEQPSRRDGALVRFQWALLTEIGLQPRLFADEDASGVPDPASRRRTEDFDPRAGGVIRGDDHDPERAGAWRVRRETLDALRALDAGGPLSFEAATLERAGRLLASYLMHALDRDLPTARAAFGDQMPSSAKPAR